MLPPQYRNGLCCKSANQKVVLVWQVNGSKCQTGTNKQVVDAGEKVHYFISRGGKEVQQLLYLSGCLALSGFVFVGLVEKES